MSDLITPQTLKGFRDYLPTAMMARERLMETARRVYRSYGFSPIDTPALEYANILLGKGGEESDKQLFRFIDSGERDVAGPQLSRIGEQRGARDGERSIAA